MTREELKEHCLKQVKNCEMWAKYKGEEPHGKIYEEHKLMLELLEQETVSKESYDHEYFLRKEFEIKIYELQRQLEEQTVKIKSILDKIRAEIEQDAFKDVNGSKYIFVNRVNQILDKYKAESEE